MIKWFSLFLQIKDHLGRIAAASEATAAELKKMNDPPPRRPATLRWTLIGNPVNEEN